MDIEQSQVERPGEASSRGSVWTHKARMAFAVVCIILWSCAGFVAIQGLFLERPAFRAMLIAALQSAERDTWFRVGFLLYGVLFSISGIISAVRVARGKKIGGHELLILGVLGLLIPLVVLMYAGVI